MTTPGTWSRSWKGARLTRDNGAAGLLIRARTGLRSAAGGFKHVDRLQQIPVDDYHTAITLASNRLVAEDNVKEECKTLLRGLNGDEITTLYAADRPERRTGYEHAARVDPQVAGAAVVGRNVSGAAAGAGRLYSHTTRRRPRRARLPARRTIPK